MKTLRQLLTKHTSPAWVCFCGCVIPKKGTSLSGGPRYDKGYHIHCPKCERTVAQFVDPKETQ